MERKISDDKCPVRKSMQIFAGKWTLLIIFQINRRIKQSQDRSATLRWARPPSVLHFYLDFAASLEELINQTQAKDIKAVIDSLIIL